MATIIVGVEDSPRSEDAITLAGALGRATAADVLAVCAFPYDDEPDAHFNPAMRPRLRELAESTLDRLCEPLNDDAHVRRLAVADPSPSRALQRVALQEDAALIVVGSSHAGHLGRLHPGSTAERLLQGSPCPVALAPQGHRLSPQAAAGRVSVGFDGSPEATRALAAAAHLAPALGATLRVIRVFTPDWTVSATSPEVSGYMRIAPAAEDAARDELEHAVAALPREARAEAVFLHGDPASELERESEVADLMVIGSRGYGPLRAVLLGHVSGRVAHTAACPLLIVPHGDPAPLAGLFAEARGALQSRAPQPTPR